jgi:hypothetical protein
MVGNGHKKRRLCKNKPADGGDYCRMHANHPERRVEASQAIMRVTLHDHVENAVRALGHIVEHAEMFKAADVVKAALGILDRTGHGPRQTISIQDADAELNDLLSRMRDGR